MTVVKNRLFDSSANYPSVLNTSAEFAGRAIDNNYAATYFPDVSIRDDINNKIVKVPASVAALKRTRF